MYMRGRRPSVDRTISRPSRLSGTIDVSEVDSACVTGVMGAQSLANVDVMDGKRRSEARYNDLLMCRQRLLWWCELSVYFI